ncbi:sensor histidine kinase [Novipirellula caenicola]|uniref:Histidine kinase domain-containing protein n=1 Tax=Novipirellula caenicola TaxID=1536901 RepID=A0ABP9VZK0_9BACT
MNFEAFHRSNSWSFSGVSMIRRCSLGGLCLWCLLSLVGPVYSTEPATLPISKIVDLLHTPRHEAAKRKVVRVQATISSVGDGIITWPTHPGAAKSFCLEDATGGIWVRSSLALDEQLFQDASFLSSLSYGTKIELVGLLDAGGFSPVLLPMRITKLGEGHLPAATVPDMKRFLGGAENIRRVTVRGVVQNVTKETKNYWLLRVETGVGHFLVRLPLEEQYGPDRMLDAELQITGLAGASRNWRFEFVCPRMIVDHRGHVEILKPAPNDPFSVTKVSLAQLDGFKPEGRPLHRLCSQGTVTYCDGDSLLYIQDDGVGVRVSVSDLDSIEIGERVEVSGFIDNSHYFAGFRGASVRKLGDGEATESVLADLPEIFDERSRFVSGEAKEIVNYEGRLVHLEGEVLSFQPRVGNGQNQLVVDCGQSTTTAFLPGKVKPLRPGTKVLMTGIANMTFASPDTSANLAMPTGLDLLLRDARDISILEEPSWWTRQRTLAALTVITIAALSAFLWAFTLRRSLDRQTSRLAREMRDRHDASLEFQASIRERTRLAANLHDTVLQTLAGIAYQIDACGQLATANSSDDHQYLRTARHMIQRGQNDLRNVVWALHCMPLEDGTFVDSVNQLARKQRVEQDMQVNVQCDEPFPVLADFIAGNLLLIIQEAIHNTIKHASATNVDVKLSWTPGADHVAVSVIDDGVGFDTSDHLGRSDGHFGVVSMEQRVRRLGGTFAIESQPGAGTTLRVSIPLKEFDPAIDKEP